jgi:hypothetical protein
VQPGRYNYLRQSVILETDPSGKLALRVEPATGGYFNGRLTSLRSELQATPDPRIAVSADYTINRLEDVGMPQRSLTTPCWDSNCGLPPIRGCSS